MKLKNTSWFAGITLVACLLGCETAPVSTTPPPTGQGLNNVDYPQSETAMVTAKQGFGLTPPDSEPVVVSLFNDWSAAASFGGVEVPKKGSSMMGWAVSGDGRTWAYRGKMRPPSGWASIGPDPAIAVDMGHPNLVYMLHLATSEPIFDEFSPDGINEGNTVFDGFCVARSFNGGVDAGSCSGDCIDGSDLTPNVASCHLAFPLSELEERTDASNVVKGLDQSAITVDWYGRLWVAAEDRLIERIRIWRSADSYDGWDNFVEIVPCGEPGDQTDCIPAEAMAFIGNRGPVLRSEDPCDRSLSSDCTNAPNGGSGVFLGSYFYNFAVASPSELRMLSFGHIRSVDPLTCTTNEECVSGSCLVESACTCATAADCPAGQTCDAELHCTGSCVGHSECPSRNCDTAGRCGCQSNADCAFGQGCFDGVCLITDCFSDTDCPADWYCPTVDDPNVVEHGVLPGVCAQVPFWQGIDIGEFCELGSNFDRPALWNYPNGEIVIGLNEQALAFKAARAFSFDVGPNESDENAIRFAYQFAEPDPNEGTPDRRFYPLSHLQLAELATDSAGELRCDVHPGSRTDLILAARALNPQHQQFQPIVEYSNQLIGVPASRPGAPWQMAYLSTHRSPDPGDRYIVPVMAGIARLNGVVSFIDGRLEDNLDFPSEEAYPCPAIAPGGGVPGDPPTNPRGWAYWGDYFGITQVLGSLAEPFMFVVIRGHLNVATFTSLTSRPLGAPDPCVESSQPTYLGPHHVESFSSPVFFTDVIGD